MALSMGFKNISFPPSCYSSYGVLDSYPGGTLTHCSCQPSLDAHFRGVILEQSPRGSRAALYRSSYKPLAANQRRAARHPLDRKDILSSYRSFLSSSSLPTPEIVPVI